MNLARPAGFEPATLGFGNQYSIQLSYGREVTKNTLFRPERPRRGLLGSPGSRYNQCFNQVTPVQGIRRTPANEGTA